MDGWTGTEIARELGRTPSWVSERLSKLRQEIQLQNGLLPPLTDSEYDALRDSIRTHGVQHPVLVGQHITIVDGRHRLRVCTELELPCPTYWLDGFTADQEAELAIALNASRRQMTRQQKRELVEYELMRDPNRSDRRIAAVCGVTHPTVASIRDEIRGQIKAWRHEGLPAGEAPPLPPPSPEVDDVESLTGPPRQPHHHQPEPPADQQPGPAAQTPPETRRDTLGRRQPAERVRAEPRAKQLTELDCPHCHESSALIRHPDGRYELR